MPPIWVIASDIILPLATAYVVRRTVNSGSAFMFIAVVIFLVKLQRSDLWPSIIGYIMGPVVIVLIWRLVL